VADNNKEHCYHKAHEMKIREENECAEEHRLAIKENPIVSNRNYEVMTSLYFIFTLD